MALLPRLPAPRARRSRPVCHPLGLRGVARLAAPGGPLPVCGGKGAMIRLASWGGGLIGWMPFLDRSAQRASEVSLRRSDTAKRRRPPARAGGPRVLVNASSGQMRSAPGYGLDARHGGQDGAICPAPGDCLRPPSDQRSAPRWRPLAYPGRGKNGMHRTLSSSSSRSEPP